MDTEYLVKQHEKIRQQFRHDAIMREIKKREDKLFKDIAKQVGAYLLVDMAHFSGLVAGGVYPNPIEYGFPLGCGFSVRGVKIPH